MVQKPIIFTLPHHLSPDSIANGFDCNIRDTYHYWIQELSELEHNDLSSNNHPHHGNWAYFSWRNELIHIPEPDAFRKIFFSRNFPIIDQQTQNKLWDMQVAIAGLSVGSNIAIELVKTGVRRIKIADFDTLAPSNNNRITGGSIFQIGENKAELLAKKLYELNPYCEIELFPHGLTDENFDQFVHNCDIIIDEIDAFPLKNKLRDHIHSEEGKHTILLQGADLGETPIVEVERHHDPKFGNRVHELDVHNILYGNPTKLESTKMLVTIVGKENIPAPFLQNFINIKRKKQTYWAQVGLAATAVAAKITSLTVEIARGNSDKLKPFYQLNLRETHATNDQEIRQLFDKEFGYIKQKPCILFSRDEAMLPITRSYGTRKTLTLTIGNMHITIGEIPGNNLTDEELTTIHKARHSYRRWGDDLSFLINDPTDTQWYEGTWETTHLLASLEGPNNFHKLYALRKTYLSYEQLCLFAEQDNLPLEFAPWNIINKKTGEKQDLWSAFQKWRDQNGIQGNIVTATRFCTISQRENHSELEKEAAAITFAAMQLFTSETTSPDYILNIITKPSLRKVFSIKNGKNPITPAFHPAHKTFAMGSSHRTFLDEKHPTYTHYASKVPKYFAQEPMVYITEANTWRQSAIKLLKTAQAKYK
jgi:predicted ThiF/HesA family dinucleotide-utilizing enzyme